MTNLESWPQPRGHTYPGLMSSDSASSNDSSSSSGSYSDQDGSVDPESVSAASSPASRSSSGHSGSGREHPKRRKHRCRTITRSRTPCLNRKKCSRRVEARTLLEEQIWQSKVSNAWVKHLPDIFRNRGTRNLKLLFPCAGLDAPGRALACMGVRYELVGMW